MKAELNSEDKPMPKGKTHKSAPMFSVAELDLANDCAKLLWHGISFETAKSCVSDEALMSYFASPIQQYLTKQKSALSFDLNHLHRLIIAAGLKPMLRKQHELSYPQFEQFLSQHFTSFESEIKKASNSTDLWKVSSAFMKHAGKSLVDVNVQTNAGYRVPLATRILFFALPTYPLANFSNGLAKSLNLQSRPEAAIHPFYQIFHDCLVNNNKQLRKYEMPQSLGVLDDDIYLAVRNSDWWHRRVIDIALLLHFNVTKPAAPLPTIP